MANTPPLLLLAFTGALTGASALAQDAPPNGPDRPLTDEEARIAEAPPSVRITLQAGAEYAAGSFSDIEGDLDVLRLGTELTVSTRIGMRRNLSVTVAQERSFYNFDDAAGIVPADPANTDPLSEGQIVSVRPLFGGREASGMAWFVTGAVEWAGEPGAVFDDSATFGIGGGASWQVGESLRLGAGLFAVTRLEDDALVIPFPILEWTISDQWSLALGTQGAGGELRYRHRENLTFALEVGFEARDYRLDDDNAFSGGIFRDRSVPVALAAAWTPSERFTLTGRIGALAWSEAEFLDAGGDRVTQEDRDVAFLVGLDLRFSF